MVRYTLDDITKSELPWMMQSPRKNIIRVVSDHGTIYHLFWSLTVGGKTHGVAYQTRENLVYADDGTQILPFWRITDRWEDVNGESRWVWGEDC